MLFREILIKSLFIILVDAKHSNRYGNPYRYSTHRLSGTGSQSAGHTYPQSTGLSGHAPSGNSHTGYHRSEVHHHYHYNPPQQINYGSTYHPVYHGTPPVYVYEYRDSGSRFDTILTGLALYNLGRMSQNNHNYHDYNNRDHYRGTPGEVCKLSISKSNGECEETRIDCKLMSSFIWDAQRGTAPNSGTSTVNQSSNVTKIITVNHKTNETMVSETTVTVVNAVDVKGPSIKVVDGMSCFMIRISRDSSVLKRKVECGLLQAYATRSLRSHANRVRISQIPVVVIIILILFETWVHNVTFD